MRDLAAQAWKKLVNDRHEGIRALRALAVIADSDGDTWAAREYTRGLAQRDPMNRAHEMAVINYDLLLGENIEASTKAAETIDALQTA